MILITGTMGFIGSVFLEKAETYYGAQNIIVLSSKQHPKFKTIVYNRYSYDFIELNEFKFEIVFHIGSFTPKSQDDANNVEGSYSNISFTKQLFSILNYPCKFIFLSTLDVYANVSDPISERTICAPSSLYGYSKLFIEKMLESWAKLHDTQIQILRIGHVYGPGEEKYAKFLPIALKKIISNEPLTIFGDGSDIRSFMHVKDVVGFIIKSVDLSEYKEPINICGNQPYSLLQIIKIISDRLEKKVNINYENRIGNPRHLLFDNSKRLNLLGEEQVNFIDGLEEEFNYLCNEQ